MKGPQLAFYAAVIAALIAFPLAVENSYYIHLVETIMIYAIVLFGLTSSSATPARCRSVTPACSVSARTPPACW